MFEVAAVAAAGVASNGTLVLAAPGSFEAFGTLWLRVAAAALHASSMQSAFAIPVSSEPFGVPCSKCIRY